MLSPAADDGPPGPVSDVGRPVLPLGVGAQVQPGALQRQSTTAPGAGVVRPRRPATAEGTDDERPSRAGGGSAFDPGRRGVRALAVLAAVVVLVAGVIAWRSRPRAEPVVAEPAPAAAQQDPLHDQQDPRGAPPDSPTASPSGAEVVVAVAGKVRNPGLVRLPAGSRVADALAAAGGALPGTDVALLNLARKVSDGELILVGVTAPPGAVAGPAGPAPPGGASGGAAAGEMVNLNTATLSQLDGLPGVGPVLAQRILDHREKSGPFRTVSDLRQVDGIGDTRYEQLKDLVTV
ncbi:ComEA family DNA-binding protein [Phytohabitans kaempferiae]|uniref:ComEA family DNA-binding protein n=1 Tax=Phytohabitans kaempferiae TaxID=1620943 RepID=A0ABV6MDG9_9ACTN